MYLFIAIATLLTLAAVGVIAIPLLRPTRSGLAPATWGGVIGAGVLLVGAPLLYVTLSNWSWKKAPGIHSPESMVEGLVRKLDDHPNDLGGWLMLGRSYVALQEYPLAARAYGRADRAAGGRSAEALLGEAEALTLSDDSELTGRAGQLIERALTIAPDDPHALLFGATAALRRGDLALARSRFNRLLAMNLPADVRSVIEREAVGIDRDLAPPAATPARALAPAQRAGESAAPVVRVRIVLSPALRRRAPAGAPLYVFVRDPVRPGPPLAVKRLVSRFPQAVELSAADAMVPGLTLAAGQRLQVVARVAPSGNPLPESGDLFGEVAYTVGRDGWVTVTVDHVTP
jgi:cytochrome c-type biogenesis protein CcmH